MHSRSCQENFWNFLKFPPGELLQHLVKCFVVMAARSAVGHLVCSQSVISSSQRLAGEIQGTVCAAYAHKHSPDPPLHHRCDLNFPLISQLYLKFHRLCLRDIHCLFLKWLGMYCNSMCSVYKLLNNQTATLVSDTP